MKPSRALYVICGASWCAAALLPIPDSGVFFFVLAAVSTAGALAFDWNEA